MEIYKQNIIKERPNALVKIIKVQSDKMGGFCYHLLFITNKTKGGNQWLRAIDKAKEEIESNADTAVELALNVIKGRQTELKGFFE